MSNLQGSDVASHQARSGVEGEVGLVSRLGRPRDIPTDGLCPRECPARRCVGFGSMLLAAGSRAPNWKLIRVAAGLSPNSIIIHLLSAKRGDCTCTCEHAIDESLEKGPQALNRPCFCGFTWMDDWFADETDEAQHHCANQKTP